MATEALKSGIMWYRHTFHYVNTLKKQLQSLLGDIFWFYMMDNEFITKTINEGNTDLAQYPAATVRQMA